MTQEERIRQEIERKIEEIEYVRMLKSKYKCKDSLPDNDFLNESIIASKDLDLDKEYNDFVESDPVYSKLVNNIVGKAIARHFAEWGAKHLKM